MASVSGYLNRVLINTRTLRAHRWTVDWKVDDFDVTTFENVGVGCYLPGIADFTITMDCYFDPVDNPYGSLLKIKPGNFGVLRIVHDKTSISDVLFWNFPNVLFTDVREESGARDVIRYNFTAKASAYTSSQALVTTPAV